MTRGISIFSPAIFLRAAFSSFFSADPSSVTLDGLVGGIGDVDTWRRTWLLPSGLVSRPVRNDRDYPAGTMANKIGQGKRIVVRIGTCC